MKVLIITYYWPPAGGSGVQRWLFFVKYLKQYGIEPVVYTAGGAAYPVLDEQLARHIPQGTKVLHGRIWEPGRIFRRGQNSLSAGLLPEKPGFKQRFLNYIRANYFIPDARRYWIKPSVRFLKEYLREHPVDWIISTGPPHSVHIIARNLKRKLGVRWLADFRDPWTDIDYFHRLPLTPVSYARHRKLESTVLSEANILTVVSKEMQKKYIPYNKNCHVVPNGFEGQAKPPEVYHGRFFTLTHIGMLNADRNPEMFWVTMADMLEKYPNLTYHLRIRLIGKVCEEAKRSARRHGLMKYVEIVDYIPFEEIEEIQEDSAVLLLFVNRVPGAGGIVTGKVFEYLRSGKPILAIGPAKGDLAKILAETHSGVIVDFDDKETLIQELNRLYDKFRQGTLKAETRDAEKYSRQKLTGELSKLLKSYSTKI